ncbi:MAG: hypoxanthine phosphoribosyltransferase [Myxococcales bacterium]|nr:hypoxanthine phosphoribosyltransferase [Myxococcales bacterium]
MQFYDSKQIEVMLSAEEIAARIAALGRQITKDYEGLSGGLVIVGVLRGCFMFLADLARAIDLPLEVDFLGVSSYGEAQESSGVVRMTQDLSRPVAGKHVLVVEDIVDTGLTLKYLLENLATRHPASVKVAALLHKPARTRVENPIDYLGFEIPDRFVIGYGLDYESKLRNLPFIGVNIGGSTPWKA